MGACVVSISGEGAVVEGDRRARGSFLPVDFRQAFLRGTCRVGSSIVWGGLFAGGGVSGRMFTALSSSTCAISVTSNSSSGLMPKTMTRKDNQLVH